MTATKRPPPSLSSFLWEPTGPVFTRNDEHMTGDHHRQQAAWHFERACEELNRREDIVIQIGCEYADVTFRTFPLGNLRMRGAATLRELWDGSLAKQVTHLDLQVWHLERAAWKCRPTRIPFWPT